MKDYFKRLPVDILSIFVLNFIIIWAFNGDVIYALMFASIAAVVIGGIFAFNNKVMTSMVFVVVIGAMLYFGSYLFAALNAYFWWSGMNSINNN